MAACFAGSAAADEASPDFKATTMTGDWNGVRTELYNKGIEVGLVHKSDILSNLSGGIKRGTVWEGYTEASIAMDLDKLAKFNGTTAYIAFNSALGSKFNRDYAGTFSGVDNIETSVNTAQFYQAWLQKNYSNDSLSVLAGLYAIDSEFYVTDTSGLFLQPPYGMANDLAQAGQNGPPIYPMGALGVRVKYTSPSKNYYAQYALTDGVPGDPNNPRGTHIQLNKGDGSLSVMELGLTPETPAQDETEYFNKTAIGFWHYTSRFNDLDPAITQTRSNQGIYFIAERTLMTEQADASQGLSGFVRFGTASKEVNQADWTGSVGLRYHGLFDGRDDDLAGIALTYNHASDTFRRLNVGAVSAQTQVEATYRAQINPWFALQPTLQFISDPNMKIDPNGNPALQNVWVVGTRIEINL
jgi:porin